MATTMAALTAERTREIVRLEQGRATTPSGQVVAALARALQLTRAERDDLYSLAGLQPPGHRMINDRISPGVQHLLARLGDISVAVFAADWRLVLQSPQPREPPPTASIGEIERRDRLAGLIHEHYPTAA
jgi:hypothetical protein